MNSECAIFTLFKVRFVLVATLLLATNACTSISIYKETKYWTQFQTELNNSQILFINFLLPPGGKIVNAPPKDISNPKKLEYLLLGSNYFYMDKPLPEVTLYVVLYNVTYYSESDLLLLSNKLSQDHNIISHNSSLAWHKNQGKIIPLNNRSVLYRKGYSTGPNMNQKLENKVEDAYLLQLNKHYVMGIYVQQFVENSEIKEFLSIVPDIIENIAVRTL